jgi:SAM-dependent methyltransferase
MAGTDPTQRFSDRVANYVKYRPGYPAEIIPFLAEAIGLTPAYVVADVGSGTGLLTRLFLENGNVVFGVEPNDKMRAAAENGLSRYHNFRSVAATAEATTLPDRAIDLVTAGQAFHWFDPGKTRAEFGRILRPGGFVALIWNERRHEGSPFMAGYEALLREFGQAYDQVCQRNATAELAELESFFAPGTCAKKQFANVQEFDFEALRGRFLSSSYAPTEAQPCFRPMITALGRLFDSHQQDGCVRFEYECRLYYGRLEP